MRLKHIYIILVGLLFYACDGQTKKNICTSDIAIKKISQLPEIVKQGKYIDSLTNHKHGVSFMVEDDLVGKKKYFRIKSYCNRFKTEYHSMVQRFGSRFCGGSQKSGKRSK